MSIARSSSLRNATSSLLQRSPVLATRAFTTQKAASINVAANDDGAPTGAITVAVKAGPRYESVPGAAHVLKNFLFKSTDKRSAMSLVRESELYGGVLSSTLTKEHLFLTAEFLRGDEGFFAELLGEVLSSSKFLRHELEEEVLPNVEAEYEQSVVTPSVLALDQITQIAYRQKGVGASLFASPTSGVSHAQAVDFARASFGQDNLAVLASGIDSASLSSLVTKHFAGVSASSASQKSASNYFGGEQRISLAVPHGSDSPRAQDGHFAIAFEGGAVGAKPELAVLRELLGGESSIKWSAGLSPYSQISANHFGSSVSAFNLNFSDTGLFGAYISAPHESIGSITKEAVNVLKEIASKTSEEDVRMAVAKAKFDAASAIESRAGSHGMLGAQLVETGKITPLESVLKALDGVSASAVSAAAEKLLKSKPTTVAIGDLHKLPYADEVL